jgi:hypothetical protein
MHAGAVMRSAKHSDTGADFDRYRENEFLFQTRGAMRLVRQIAALDFAVDIACCSSLVR